MWPFNRPMPRPLIYSWSFIYLFIYFSFANNKQYNNSNRNTKWNLQKGNLQVTFLVTLSEWITNHQKTRDRKSSCNWKENWERSIATRTRRTIYGLPIGRIDTWYLGCPLAFNQPHLVDPLTHWWSIDGRWAVHISRSNIHGWLFERSGLNGSTRATRGTIANGQLMCTPVGIHRSPWTLTWSCLGANHGRSKKN